VSIILDIDGTSPYRCRMALRSLVLVAGVSVGGLLVGSSCGGASSAGSSRLDAHRSPSPAQPSSELVGKPRPSNPALLETATGPVGSPDAVAAGPDGKLLAALQKGPTLAVVDPARPTVLRRDRLGHVDQLYDQANIDLLVRDDGTAWVTSYLEGGVYRVDP
jgi:hypothetical protein